MFICKGFFVDHHAVLLNIFYQNSFSFFWNILKKTKQKPFFHSWLQYLTIPLYGKVKISICFFFNDNFHGKNNENIGSVWIDSIQLGLRLEYVQFGPIFRRSVLLPMNKVSQTVQFESDKVMIWKICFWIRNRNNMRH